MKLELCFVGLPLKMTFDFSDLGLPKLTRAGHAPRKRRRHRLNTLTETEHQLLNSARHRQSGSFHSFHPYRVAIFSPIDRNSAVIRECPSLIHQTVSISD